MSQYPLIITELQTVLYVALGSSNFRSHLTLEMQVIELTIRSVVVGFLIHYSFIEMSVSSSI